MTELEMRKLKVRDVVSFLWDDGSSTLPGTVEEVGCSGVFISWADGQRGWVDFRDGEHLREER